MKTLIVYASVHHQNTEKVAKVIAAELGADLVPIGQAQPDTLTAYDLIGFGSGIYAGKFHQALLRFVEMLPTVAEKQAFVFSTCGIGGTQWHAALERAAGEPRILGRGRVFLQRVGYGLFFETFRRD